MWQNIKKFQDAKENVTKFVFEKDDIAIEAVLYKYPTYQERTVLCISVMCGCPIGCRFCGTGHFYARNLSTEEIIGQARYILENEIDGVKPNEINRLQIMFMSMGEGMLNRRGLESALWLLNGLYPNAALLVSTSGPKVDYGWMREVSSKIPTVGLQFSIHESTDEAREKLIPFKAKLSLAEIAEEGRKWYEATGRKPFFNYCAHEGNSTDADAMRLLSLFNPSIWEATVSVICERDQEFGQANEYQRSLASGFANLLVENGFNVRVFDPAGQDTIGGGCGMLWFTQQWAQAHPELIRPSCGNGLQKVHAPMLKTVKSV